jgi:hypothetical protein
MINLRISLLDLMLIFAALIFLCFFSWLSFEDFRGYLPSEETFFFLGKTFLVGGALFVLTMVTAWGEK